MAKDEAHKRVYVKMPTRTFERLERIARVRDKTVQELILDWVALRLSSIPQEKANLATPMRRTDLRG